MPVLINAAPFAVGESYASVKSKLVTLVEFWLGTGAASGGNTPTMWADMRTKLNQISTVLGFATIADGESGSSVRAKLNALNDAILNADIAAAYSRYSTPPTDARAKVQAQLLFDIKNCGAYPILDGAYALAAADAQAATRNIIQDAFHLTQVASPTFTADRDFLGNASTSYLETGVNPSTPPGGLKFTLNSACLGFYSRTDVTDSQYFDIGNTNSRFNARSTIGPAFRGPLNDATSFVASPMNTDSLGLFAVNRSASNARQGYIRGASVGSDAVVSTSLSNETIQILRGTFNFSARRCAFVFFGGSMTAQMHAGMYAAIQRYLTSLGAQV